MENRHAERSRPPGNLLICWSPGSPLSILLEPFLGLDEKLSERAIHLGETNRSVSSVWHQGPVVHAITLNRVTRKLAKLGRPPDTNSAATRGRLIDAARKCFGEFGYESTTNRMIADQAGITTGAIYHYFASKLDIFCTVEQEVHQYVYRRFALALEGQETMVGKLEMMLETAHGLHRDDPTLARFLASHRIDSQRVPELRDGLQARGWPIRDQFVADLVAAGIASGEVGEKSGPLIDGLMKTLTVGLTDAFLEDLEGQRLAIDGIKAVLREGIAFDAQGPPG